MKYHFKVHKEGDGFWAECIELPGCVSQGDSKEELLENIQDALNSFLEEPENSQYLAPLPKKSLQMTRSTVEVPVDPSVALAYSIRRQRIKNGLTQKDAAEKLGMKTLYNYQRLERRCNPTLNLIVKLAMLFPALSIDKILR